MKICCNCKHARVGFFQGSCDDIHEGEGFVEAGDEDDGNDDNREAQDNEAEEKWQQLVRELLEFHEMYVMDYGDLVDDYINMC